MSSRAQFFVDAFVSSGGDETVGAMRLEHLTRMLGADFEHVSALDPEEVDDLAWAFDSLAINAARDGAPESKVAELAARSFHIRTALWSSPEPASPYRLWMLIVSGTLAQRQPELRLLLSNYSWPRAEVEGEEVPWAEQVWQKSAESLGLLARKSRSWLDVDEATRSLYALAELQSARETEIFADSNHEDWRKDKQKCKLLGMYHIAESLVTLGAYLRTGDAENIRPVLQRHGEHARNLLASAGDIELERIGESVEPLTVAMARASIWFNTTRLSQAAREFARRLAGEDRSRPVSELWWSQREALAQSLLDPYKTAVSVQMPTSAGKTLMAEFSIVQTMALNPASTIAYLVPTRALVNQMTRRLREDLTGATASGAPVTVEAAVPVFELDPTESGLLSVRPDVLVTTPEKLDLLVRAEHPSVADISLVVVDEAHHIADSQRGARLELLLATIKRERGASCRFLLLTPFLPNARELSFWLGDEGGVAIELNWKPSEQVRALGKWARKAKKYRDTLCLVPSATQPESWDNIEIDLGESLLQPSGQRQRPGVSTSLAIKLSDRAGGGALVLTGGPATAEARALQVVEYLPGSALGDEPVSSSILDAAIDYISGELGSSYPLTRTLPHGVAFHHAGLPPEVRYLVEVLLADGHLKVVTGTSTLAQGVDFPISAVIIEALTVSQGRGKPHRDLMYSEFWNIAGRAGRALKDSVGLVVYPSISKKHDETFRRYLQGEADNVVSALLEAVRTLDDLRPEYNLSLVRQQPILSHFFQYLTHALKVAGYETASAEVEEILRSSLAFHTLQAEDRNAAENLVSWARSFLTQVRQRPLLGVADVTGLSLPSVGLLSNASPAAFREPEFWHPDSLFGDDLTNLSSVVQLLSEIPEMSLGMPEEAGGINPGRVAGVLRDWVRGSSLPEIAETWFSTNHRDLSRVGRYLFRELSGQLPWGIGALQLIELSGNESDGATLARHVPAMSFYGVDSIEALPMRMVGVPRAAARRLGDQAPEFTSFSQAREWVAGLPDSVWRTVAREKGFQPSTLKTVWETVGGSAG